MAEEVLGSGISKGVADQLLLRESLVGQPNKSKDHLLFFNSNGAWVRLASSINTLNQTQADLISTTPQAKFTVKGSNKLAQNNVLFGGMYPDNVKPGGGILSETFHNPLNIDSEKFITPNDVKIGSYHNYESRGIRPIPGINSVSIQSKNTYGTLREAEVSITVWTLEDLELMQTLYLRPGYSMLLEWGHSLGLDNGGLLKDPLVYQDFLKSKQKQQAIEEYLLKNAEDNSYNYDGMYGYVSNFSWSFRKDGGYDCTVKIVSKGVIIESLTMAFDTSNVYPVAEITPEKQEESKEERKSIYHKFRAVLNSAPPRLYPVQGFKFPNQGSSTPGNVFKQFYARFQNGQNLDNSDGTPSDFKKNMSNFFAFPLSVSEEGNRKSYINPGVRTLGSRYYVTLGTILELFNNYISIVDPNTEKKKGTNTEGYKYVEFYTGQQDENTEIGEINPYEKVSKFLTTDYHFSINPSICILPRQGDYRELSFKDKDCNDIKLPPDQETGNLSALGLIGAVQNNNFDLAIAQAFKNNFIRGDKDDILNIFISVDYVTDIIDEIIDQDKNADQNTSNNMTTFMQRLLEGINDSLGGVNDLDIQYSESENLYFVVDRRLTPASQEEIREITLAGINSTITNLQISSKISSNIASQVSIAAQGGNQGSKDNIGPLLQWNRGLLDRHLQVKVQKKPVESEDDTTPSPEKDRLTKWLEDYSEVWRVFKTLDRSGKTVRRTGKEGDATTYKTPEQLDSTVFNNISSLTSYHKTYCQKYVTEYYYKAGEGNPPPGVIPVELSFDTIGIAGLKIGQAFRVKKGVLPEIYNEEFGFIITGLNHSISNNKWTTSVKTQFFCLKPPPEYILAQYRKDIGLDCTPVSQEEPTTENTPNADRLREVLNSLGYSEKGEELSNGGDITEELFRFASSLFTRIKQILPDISIVVTGGNDIYHQNVTYRSSHAAGLGLDFVIAPQTPANKLKVEEILGGFAGGNQDKSVSFINEYDYPSTAATGGHFHIKIGGSIEGNPVTSDYIAQANLGNLTTYPIT